MESPRRIHLMRAAVALGSVPLAFVIAEVVVRLFFPSYDMQAVLPLLYINPEDPEIHEPDPDPRVLVRLRAGSSASYSSVYGPYQVQINSLGFRGREVPAERRDGVFRIICVGGSNVYGGGIDDDETWPARIELQLNAESPSRYEVWNGAVIGYNSLQMATVAERYLAEYDPDLLVFAPSNPTARYFLAGTPDLRQYFKKDPSLWREVLPPGHGAGDFLPWGLKQWLLARSRLARIVLCRSFEWEGGRDAKDLLRAVEFPNYIRASRELLQSPAAAGRVVVFIAPFVPLVSGGYLFEEHYSGLDVPVFVLDAEGMPEEYLDPHPQVHVMDWYASELIAWMRAEGVL